MPIDPSIYNAIQPVAPANQMQTLAQISAIRNQQMERQEAQQRIQINQAAEDRLKQSATLGDQKRNDEAEGLNVVRNVMKTSLDEKGNFNYPLLQQGLVQAGHGDLAPALIKSLMDFDEKAGQIGKQRDDHAVAVQDLVGGYAADALKLPLQARIGALQTGLGRLVAMKTMTEDEAATYINQVRDSPETATSILQSAVNNSPQQRKLQNEAKQPQLVGPQGGTMVGPDGTTTVIPAVGEPAPTAAGLAVKAANGDRVAAAALRLLHPPAGSGGTGGYSQDDVKLTVQGMRSGHLPPVLPGRASPSYNALMAESERQGFDLSRAATDWVATQTHVKTLNNAQQTRLNQSINALPDILDTVQTLADKWNGGQYPLLNRANLAAAKNGVYGTEAASVATQLEAQIADAAADLGNVYMGGNSPTDYALRLAQTSLSGNWDRKVLTDMVKLAKQNVQVRRNSINNTGVQGASEDNPYAPPSPAAAAPAVPPPAAGANPFRK